MRRGEELLDGGEVGAGVEEVPGVGTPQVLGRGRTPRSERTPAEQLAHGLARN
ncbi:MAG: hypothetical protein M3314_03825 [Actinomycetota bacterium]|nr:hypothetical protein [Actinomycetota bacterium]